jgi:hypothetical protein
MSDIQGRAHLPSQCGIAFKEWAVVCEALASGQQTIILRKGGIHEGRAGFRVEHDAFWLYPTNFHQQPDALLPAAGSLLRQAAARRPPEGELHLSRLAAVEQVIELRGEEQLARLAGLHIWSEQTLHNRFHYRQPGLFLLVVRVWQRAVPHVVAESPKMAGCRSWVELPTPLSTDALSPVVSDDEFAAQSARVLEAVGGGS